MDFTPLARTLLLPRARRAESWTGRQAEIQERQLRRLLRHTKGKVASVAPLTAKAADSHASAGSIADDFRQAVPLAVYDDIADAVMEMIEGRPDVLWPGICRCYAQSSGTSSGRSKYIPVTDTSLAWNHYAGASDAVAFYLQANPGSRMFAGKGFVLGGSYASQFHPADPRVRIGDLSATLISRITPLAGLFRVPSRRIALMSDWTVKLPALAEASVRKNVTNISGVPSWFMRVLLKVMESRGTDRIADVWPNLEVFFHGGISFEPYREEYERICRGLDMHFVETYNASEGFFAAQYAPASAGDTPGPCPMRLLLDVGVFYEFLPLGATKTLLPHELKQGHVYELVITAPNGLWRYRLGDTVRVERLSPLEITVAGRTASFINAFGEELMEHNAEEAIARACELTESAVVNYTAAPVYAGGARRGRHQWLIEWRKRPADIARFADVLDTELRSRNSDYDAKRSGSIFLDAPLITSAPDGFFDRWLAASGTGKLGGQRKVPRLCNDRHILDPMLQSISNY